jgi:DNA sulfur modification protein DndD
MKRFDTSEDELPIDPSEQNEIIFKNQEEIKRIDESIAEFNSKIAEIDRYLSKNSNENLKTLTSERERLEKRKTQLKKEIEQTQKSLGELIIDRLPVVLAYAALTKTVSVIDENTAKGLLPPKIQDTFVRDLLDEGVCICGRPLDENSECRARLLKLIDNVFSKNTAEDSSEGRYTIKTLLNKVDFVEEYNRVSGALEGKKGEFDQILDQLGDISSQISALDEIEIKKKEDERKGCIESVNRLNYRKGELANGIDVAREILKECEEEINKLNISEDKYSKLKVQRDYVCKLESVLTGIRDSIVEDVRLQLETKTRSYFYDMIWKTGTFENVRLIDEGARYRFSVTQDGQECLGDLSSGEKQILALAFSAALHSVSGYSVPVFIDTPLGRISEDVRENVAASLPKYLSGTQLIIMPTDTEYTSEIRSKMSQFVGAEYKIRYDEGKKMSEVNNYD